MKKNKLKEFLTYGAIIVVFVFSLSFYKPASSDVSGSLSGYAWNSYKVNTGDTDNKWLGMAWLGFNVSSGSVSVDNTTGDLSGYAWSPYYGWLKFGGFSGFPSGSGTVSSNAKFNFSNNTLTGWARFCGVFASGCSGSLFPDSNNGGWDGWVSLSGTGYGAVLNPSTGTFSGYAWGGSDVVGAIDFSRVTANNISNIPNSGFTLYANGGSTASVNSGDMVTLAWSGNNVNTPGNCQASGAPDGGWGGSKVNPPSTYTLNPALTNNTSSPITKTFTITCDKIGGGTVSSSATVTVDAINPSSVNIGISPMCTNTPSTRYYLAFRTTSGFTGTTSCTGGYWPSIPINLPVISPAVSGSTYNISCSDNAGHNATVAGNIPTSCDNPCDPSTDPACQLTTITKKPKYINQ